VEEAPLSANAALAAAALKAAATATVRSRFVNSFRIEKLPRCR
jgi:hypothetical protein